MYWWNLELLYHAFMPDYVAKILQIPLSQFDVPNMYIIFRITIEFY